MNIKEAAKKTLEISTSKYYKDKEGCDKLHIDWMLKGIAEGYITGEKAHRWLGWAQAIICIYERTTLKELKEINKNASN